MRIPNHHVRGSRYWGRGWAIKSLVVRTFFGSVMNKLHEEPPAWALKMPRRPQLDELFVEQQPALSERPRSINNRVSSDGTRKRKHSRHNSFAKRSPGKKRILAKCRKKTGQVQRDFLTSQSCLRGIRDRHTGQPTGRRVAGTGTSPAGTNA